MTGLWSRRLQNIALHNQHGWSVVVEAFDVCRAQWLERYRFARLGEEMQITDAPPEYHASVMSLINTLLSGEHDIHARNRMRNELNGVGLKDAIAELKKRGIDADPHFESVSKEFERMYNEDLRMDSYAHGVNIEDPVALSVTITEQV